MELTHTTDIIGQCFKTVGPTQKALQCDECLLWTHVACGTGYSRADYREIIKQTNAGISFEWKCNKCRDATGEVSVTIAPAHPSVQLPTERRTADLESMRNDTVAQARSNKRSSLRRRKIRGKKIIITTLRTLS